jgi:TonB family protein
MPFSAWLADQFSSALAGAGQQLDIIDRSQLAEYVKSHNVSPQEMFESATARELGKQIGAIIVVRGALGPAENGFGISLNAFTVSPPKRKKTNQSLGEVHGKIPMSAAISEHVGVPIEDLFPKDGVYQANEGGIGFPMCLYCPRPQFSPELMQRKIRGVVTLEAVITSEGKATQIRVTKSVERQFDREVIRAVETWSFKPAVDIDGRPTNVRQPIEIVMHPY